jgi:hypothetical protein
MGSRRRIASVDELEAPLLYALSTAVLCTEGKGVL